MGRSGTAAAPAAAAAPAIRRFSGFGGTSLLHDTRVVCENVDPLTYFQFLSLSEFLDAVLFHECVYIVGTNLDGRDLRFAEKFNGRVGAEVIRFITDEDFSDQLRTPSVAHALNQIIAATFGDKMKVAARLIQEKKRATRASEDYKLYLLEMLRGCIHKDDDEYFLLTDRLAGVLRDELVDSFNDEGKAFSLNYLFRSFLHAAVALDYDGSLLADGKRKIVRSLILSTAPRRPVALGRCLYDALNSAYSRLAEPSVKLRYPFIPLGLQYAVLRGRTREGLLSGIVEARSLVEPYREWADEQYEQLTDPSTSTEILTQVRTDVLVVGEHYLSDLASRLGQGRIGVTTVFRKIFRRTLDSIAGMPKLTFEEGDLFSVSSEVDGKALMRAVRDTARAVSEHKQEYRFRPLVDMLHAVTSERGLHLSISRELPVVDFEWQPYDDILYNAYLPRIA